MKLRVSSGPPPAQVPNGTPCLHGGFSVLAGTNARKEAAERREQEFADHTPIRGSACCLAIDYWGGGGGRIGMVFFPE